MFWRVIVYILVGLFAVSFVLPRVFRLIAEWIHRYISAPTSSASDSRDAKPKGKQGKGALYRDCAPNESISKH